jgi:hypothetical protein
MTTVLCPIALSIGCKKCPAEDLCLTTRQKFRLGLFSIAAVCLIAIAAMVSVVVYYHNRDDALRELISAGINPIAASCALGIRIIECKEIPGF